MRSFIFAALLALASFSHAGPTSISGTFTAPAQTIYLAVDNNNSWGVNLGNGFTGTVYVEGAVIPATYTALTVYSTSGNTTYTYSSITAGGVYFGVMPGMSRVRVRAGSDFVGSATCTLGLADSGSGAPVSVQFPSGMVGVTLVAANITIPVSVTSGVDGISVTAKLVSGGAAQAVSIIAGVAGVSVTATLASGGAAQGVSVLTSVLPTGASTEATLSTLNGKVTVMNSGAVSVSSSALPAGASTAALQTTGNTSLSSIDGKTPSLGSATKANSSPVVLASDSQYIGISIVAQSQAITVAGTVTTVPSGAAQAVSIISGVGGVSVTATLASGGAAQAVSVLTSVLPTGAATSANQTTIISAFSNVTVNTHAVTVASLPLPSGAATEATLSTLNGKVPSQGAAVKASSLPVVLATDSAYQGVSIASGVAGISVTANVTAGVAGLTVTASQVAGTAAWAMADSTTATTLLSISKTAVSAYAQDTSNLNVSQQLSGSAASLVTILTAISATVNSLYTTPQPVGLTRTPSIYTQQTTTFTWSTGTAAGYAYAVSWVANVAATVPVITCVSAGIGLAGVRVDFGDNTYTSAAIATQYLGGLVVTGAGEQCWGPQVGGYVYTNTSGTTAASMQGTIRGAGVR